MDKIKLEGAPRWAAPFLDALRGGHNVTQACREAGVTTSSVYKLRGRHAAFRAQWDECPTVDGRRAKRSGPPAAREASRIEQFLEELAETSNVAAAAAVADISVSKIYRLRRADPEFAKRWYAALAEGYDNLEMELLAHLRGGGTPDKARFDTAAALRCLTAHRESVAREKGRRTLAEEASTIAAINAKIDALRARAMEGEAAIRHARKDIAKRTRTNGEA